MMPDRVEAFLKQLTALTRKHQIVIGGCGCCDSPYLRAYKKEEVRNGKYKTDSDSLEDNLRWEKGQ